MVAPVTLVTLLGVVSSLALPAAAEGIIPVSEVGCWKDKVDPQRIEEAKTKLENWGRKHRIGNGSMHGEKANLSAVWICNCKHFEDDHVVAAELDETQALVEDKCGVGVAGWVWSKKWNKAFNIGTSVKMDNGHTHSDKCPHFCIWD
ncbi:hypothetical protein F4861DRAFT_543189 [Xylaria intraflava]|nr:hypothetical protein F4861DRAFT_543189 [Xylaria intraflava]